MGGPPTKKTFLTDRGKVRSKKDFNFKTKGGILPR